MSSEVRKQVEAFRRKLLDLTLRNRMLNYRPSARLSLEIVREDSTEVLRILVEEGRRMSFVGKPDPPKRRLADDELYDAADGVAMAEFRRRAEEEMDAFLEIASMPVEKMDRRLSTDEYESILQAKLRAILREASLAREELGINTLFLTLGALEWLEADGRTFRAPLIYVPVKLEKLANGSIRIIHDGSDIGDNLPLRHKLAEFSIDLPEFDDEKPLYEYFNELTSTIKGRSDWQVLRDGIHLGFFNYEKFAMYVDLGGEGWPEGRKPWEDEDLLAMLGSGYSEIPDDIGFAAIDPIRPPAACHEVYNADSSQAVALVRAAQGLSMVIEGPPGTGKSQTITNIIAEAVAAGKTVLFVSAKRAAVEVVKRRLADAGLEDMCLDLHDKLTNRKQFYSEIRRTVGRTLSIKDETQRVERFAELRARLNEHAEAVNTPLSPHGLTPFEAMIELSRLPTETAEDRDGRIPFERVKHWTHTDIERRGPVIRALQNRVAEIGIPVQNPFWGCGITFLDPAIRLDLQSALPEAVERIREAEEKLTEAASAFGISGLASASDVRILQSCVTWEQRAPRHGEIAIRDEAWDLPTDPAGKTTALLATRQSTIARLTNQVTESAWATDPTPTTQAFLKHSGKLFRFLIAEFRKAKAEALALLKPGVAATDKALKEILIELSSAWIAKLEIERAEPLMSHLFGNEWKGLQSDVKHLESLYDWVLQLRKDVASGAAPTQVLDFVAAHNLGPEHEAWLKKAKDTTTIALNAYELAAKSLLCPVEAAEDEKLETLRSRVNRWLENLPQLAAYINFSESRRQAEEANLGPVIALAERWPLAGAKLEDALKRSYYLGVVREAMEKRPALRTFERANHEQMIAEFQDLDDFSLKYNRARVRIAHHNRMPTFDQAIGNLRLLKVQCELQRSHKPIRWIMNRAGEAVQRIKPVFMMSPLSVAIHLPPELPPFDLVIFDEASQVKPEDALCAIVRAKQTIVVGDTRQMPPTNFFDRVGEGEDIEYEDEELEAAQESAKLESILSLMSSVVIGRARRPDLQWHYRSIHPGLIQPSNDMFYDGRLVVFPSADTFLGGSQVGTVFHHHPETIYEAGQQKRFNRREAEIVAEAVLHHVQTEPHLSLMVAAMNKPQADLIYREVQKRELLHPEAFAAYGPKNPSETIEIKNLETVQGDERDVVFISMTYGRDEAGSIRQHFGPILKDGGERRLNVLISRARRRCEVFSNLTADDIRAESGRAGLMTLKRYLEFAQRGRLDAGRGDIEDTTPFADEVATELTQHGYRVDTQVGNGVFRIDLAVIDPKNPNRYLLGVECDGPTYNSARSARDRDKLRSEVLQVRGWRLHRIWSHDWWQDKEAEVSRLLKALQSEVPAPPSEPEAEDESDDTYIQEAKRRLGPIQKYTVPPPVTSAVSDSHLVRFVAAVVRDEGPIHPDLLKVRLRDAQMFQSLSPRLQHLYEIAIRDSLNQGLIRKEGDAYVRDETQVGRVRDWSDVPDRKAAFVTELELGNALKQVIRSSYGVSADDAPRAAWVALGFKRPSQASISDSKAVLDALTKIGLIRSENGLLSLAE